MKKDQVKTPFQLGLVLEVAADHLGDRTEKAYDHAFRCCLKMKAGNIFPVNTVSMKTRYCMK